MTPDYLKNMLVQLLDLRFADATNLRLEALARSYGALYNGLSFGAPEVACGDRRSLQRKIDALFGVLDSRCSGEPAAALRCRMIRAMFTLVCGTVPAVDFGKKSRCCAAGDAFVQAYWESGDPLEQAAVCECITELLYPAPARDDAYLAYLQERIGQWVAQQHPDGGWGDLPTEAALARIEVMNRNSYMLLDKRFDGVVRRAFAYYRERLAAADNAGNFDARSLLTMGRLYDVCSQGNAYRVCDDTMRRIVRLLQDYNDLQPGRTDGWYFCNSYLIDAACRGIADRFQTELRLYTA